MGLHWIDCIVWIVLWCGLYYADCIVVRITLCEFYRSDCICGLHCADCIVRIACADCIVRTLLCGLHHGTDCIAFRIPHVIHSCLTKRWNLAWVRAFVIPSATISDVGMYCRSILPAATSSRM